MEHILQEYYKNEGKKLRNVVDKIFGRKYGGTADKDMDEFYSVANEVFADIVIRNRYDPSKGDFGGFLYGALELAIIDEWKKQKRDKRVQKIEVEVEENGEKKKKKVPIRNASLDDPIGEDEEEGTLGDLVAANEKYEPEKIIFVDSNDENVDKYLNGLSRVQRKIVEMKMWGIPTASIKQKLGLTDSRYSRYLKEISKFENIKNLFERRKLIIEEDKKMDVKQTTMENCKTDKISVNSIIKKIDSRMLRFDHPLQRESDQWTMPMKGNLISDILQGNRLHPLIFAEQIINGVPIIWDLDGKQRCTNVYSYVKDGYKVSKNVRRGIIVYQTMKKDENGNQFLDDNGFPIAENAEFDIRGKKFSQLPAELQDKILDYTFNYDQYLNCSEEDIGYHIERYNDGKPMTASQKGLTKLGTEYAEMVKAISNMPFFRELGGYKVSEFSNGKIHRVVVDSIMAVNFMDQWKAVDENCKYLKENATTEQFDEFEDMVSRLEKVVEPESEVSNMFDSKNSFLWFGLFAKFIKTENDDLKFVQFMTEFTQSLHSEKVNGESFDDLMKISSTKDKGIILKRCEFLENLMMDWLKDNGGVAEEIATDPLTFIQENVNPEVTDEDVQGYQEDLEVLSLDVDNNTKLFDAANKLSLLAIIAYAYLTDKPIDKWFVDYFKKNTTYDKNQKQNYINMKDSFCKANVA